MFQADAATTCRASRDSRNAIGPRNAIGDDIHGYLKSQQ
jgi:hypothetical protein